MSDNNYIPTARYCYLYDLPGVRKQYICVNDEYLGSFLYDLRCIEKGDWDIFYHICNMIYNFETFLKAYPEIKNHPILEGIKEELRTLVNDQGMDDNRYVKIMPKEVADNVLKVAWSFDWSCLEELDRLVEDMIPLDKETIKKIQREEIDALDKEMAENAEEETETEAEEEAEEDDYEDGEEEEDDDDDDFEPSQLMIDLQKDPVHSELLDMYFEIQQAHREHDGNWREANTTEAEQALLDRISALIEKGKVEYYPMKALLFSCNDWYSLRMTRPGLYKDMLKEGLEKDCLNLNNKVAWFWFLVAASAEGNDAEEFIDDKELYYKMLSDALEAGYEGAAYVINSIWEPEQEIEED